MNTVKPVTVDDTAYLLFAKHIASHPTDPYGFAIFWWSAPEPAMGVLCPPVVPYWLAVGYFLFGDSPPLLKLWLFPFVYLLAWALRALLVRFARGTEDFALPLLMLSPAVLPTVNLMLDIPAVALALAAVELFARACDSRRLLAFTSPPKGEVVAGGSAPAAGGGEANPVTAGAPHPPELRQFRRPPPGGRLEAEERGAGLRRWLLAILAGVVAALAMQAKYSAFVAPAVIAWYGLTHRRVGLAVTACAACVALFAAWELWLVEKYGRSHFWLNAATVGSSAPEGRSKLAVLFEDKMQLLPSLASYLGCLSVGAGLLAASAVRVPKRWLIGIACAWCLGCALIAVLPKRWLLLYDDVTVGTLFWHVSGFGWLVAALACAAVLLLRIRKGLSFRPNSDALFVAGWVLLELGSTLALTPFPAARRVIGLALVMGLLAARAASRMGRVRPLAAQKWVLGVGVGAGLAVAALDILDAFPEKWCAEMAADVTRDRPSGASVWYAGHWGFQHYCERDKMRPLIPGATVARAGDFVVLPVYPDDGFNRPYPGFAVSHPRWVGEVVAEFVWTDALSAQTVPNFYGGMEPVAGRDHPRLRVRVYRLWADWDGR